MILCKELNKEFATKSEMFFELKANKDKIIGLKKSAIKESDPCSFQEISDVTKTAENDTTVKIGDTIYPIINTTNYLDGHGDVHLNGIWDQTLKDQKGKIYYAINHELKIGSIISYPSEVDAYAKELNWSDLGYDFVGKTQALIFASKITEKSNGDFVKAVQSKEPLQNSVRMQYDRMELCIDSDEKGMEQEYLAFYKYLPLIANKQDAVNQGYYWAHSQAKISKEGSAVLGGSNPITPIHYTDPESSSQEIKDSPSDDSLKFNVNKLLSIF